MSFWGLNDTGKNAKGRTGEIPNWTWQRGKDNWGRSNELWDRANSGQQQGQAFWQQRRDAGATSPDQIRKVGQQIMPGMDQAIATRGNNLQTMWQNFQNRKNTAGNVSDQINSNLDTMGGNVGGLFTTRQGVIDNARNTMNTRGDDISGQVVRNIGETYGNAANNYGGAMGGLRSTGGRTYEQLYGDTGAAYDKASSNVEMLRPGSEFEQARVARSFAPSLASASSRMRQAGVDPNSPQASAMMGSAYAEQARGIDDAAAKGMGDYVSASNGLTLGRQNSLNDLGLGLLNFDTNLGLQDANTQLSLALGSGKDYQNELIRNLGMQNGIDQNFANASLGNITGSFDEGQKVLGMRNNAALQGRTMEIQDLGMENDLLNQQNNEELTKLDLQNKQYSMGFDWDKYNNQVQTGAQGQLDNMTQQDFANMWRAAQMGDSEAMQALQGYNNSLGIESANAGWGTKLLTGMAMGAAGPLLGAAAPFLGGTMTGVIGGALGGMGGGYGGGYGGGFNMGGFTGRGGFGGLPIGSGGMFDEYGNYIGE